MGRRYDVSAQLHKATPGGCSAPFSSRLRHRASRQHGREHQSDRRHDPSGGRWSPPASGLWFFSRQTTPAEAKYLAYDLELLAIYSTILKFRHILEGCSFQIFTDQKPLPSAFMKARDPISNSQCHQLAFISEFATEIAHIPGLDNIVADALTHQYDEQQSVAVHLVAHGLSNIDLSELAREQRPIAEEPASSLKLTPVQFPGVEGPIVCRTLLGRLRVLVPDSKRRQIFNEIHGLAHPSGKATLAIMARLYVWQNMRRDTVRWARQCQAGRQAYLTPRTAN